MKEVRRRLHNSLEKLFKERVFRDKVSDEGSFGLRLYVQSKVIQMSLNLGCRTSRDVYDKDLDSFTSSLGIFHHWNSSKLSINNVL